MKLTVLLLILLSLGFSQKKNSFGLVGGVNFNSLAAKSGSYQSVPSLNAMVLNYKLDEFDFSASYDVKKIEEKEGNKSTSTFSYLTVAAKYRLQLGKIYLSAGPAVGYELDAKRIVKVNGKDKESDITNTNKYRVSAILGAGYYLNDNLSLTTSYDFGLTDFDKDSKSRLSSFQVGVGIWF